MHMSIKEEGIKLVFDSPIGIAVENVRIRVTSNREKAMAACELGNTMLELGESREMAAHLAGHELKHALAHKGSGYLAVISNKRRTAGYYEREGLVTAEEHRQIASAVGRDDMSSMDKKIVDNSC